MSVTPGTMTAPLDVVSSKPLHCDHAGAAIPAAQATASATPIICFVLMNTLLLLLKNNNPPRAERFTNTPARLDHAPPIAGGATQRRQSNRPPAHRKDQHAVKGLS